MNGKKKLRLIPDRMVEATVSLGCTDCSLLHECGGYTRASGAWSCEDACAGCNENLCDVVCLRKKIEFKLDYAEVNGFGLDGLDAFCQHGLESFPGYVPVIFHGSMGTTAPLPFDTVAIPLDRVVTSSAKGAKVKFSSASELRAEFCLAANTRVILRGTGQDQPIEDYWQWAKHNALGEQLAALDLFCAIAPNYSVIRDHPRTQHLHNRKRSLLIAEQWSRLSIPTVPYLHALSDPDWPQYRDMLREHPEIRVLAKEFRTGHGNPHLAAHAIDMFVWLQEQLGRTLHLVAIGGSKVWHSLRMKLGKNVSFIDSHPWVPAAYRREASQQNGVLVWKHLPNANPSELLINNVAVRRAMFE